MRTQVASRSRFRKSRAAVNSVSDGEKLDRILEHIAPNFLATEELAADLCKNEEVLWEELEVKDQVEMLANPNSPLASLTSGQRELLGKGVEVRVTLEAMDAKSLRDRYRSVAKYDRKRDAATADSVAFFQDDEATADFDHWGAMTSWTTDEAVALVNGKEPNVVNATAVAALPAGSPFRLNYLRIGQRLERAVEAGKLGRPPIAPSSFVAWFHTQHIPAPPEMLGMAAPPSGSPPDDEELRTRVRHSLHRMLYVLAFPKGASETAFTNVVSRILKTAPLTDAGPMDDGTIRKHLKAAIDLTKKLQASGKK